MTVYCYYITDTERGLQDADLLVKKPGPDMTICFL